MKTIKLTEKESTVLLDYVKYLIGKIKKPCENRGVLYRIKRKLDD